MQAVHFAEGQRGALNAAGRWNIWNWVPLGRQARSGAVTATLMGEYIVVIDWLPALDALPEYRRWLRDRGWSELDVNVDQIRIDTGTSELGDLQRVRIAQTELVRLGIDPSSPEGLTST
jgi:hypothetical protein